jgi:hypothetical protein
MLRWSIARVEIAVETEERVLASLDPSKRVTALKERARDFEVEHPDA